MFASSCNDYFFYLVSLAISPYRPYFLSWFTSQPWSIFVLLSLVITVFGVQLLFTRRVSCSASPQLQVVRETARTCRICPIYSSRDVIDLFFPSKGITTFLNSPPSSTYFLAATRLPRRWFSFALFAPVLPFVLRNPIVDGCVTMPGSVKTADATSRLCFKLGLAVWSRVPFRFLVHFVLCLVPLTA